MRPLKWLFFLLAIACCLAANNTNAAERRVHRVLYRRDFYVAIKEVARFYNLRASKIDNLHVKLSNNSHNLILEFNSRRLYFDGSLVWLNCPLARIRGHWSIRETDLKTIIDPLLRPECYLQDVGIETVVIDPGHGGRDPGTIGSKDGPAEKDIALDIARRVYTHLKAAGFNVYLTRNKDITMDLADRVNKAERHRAHIFVSIHLNAGKRDISGEETYVLSAIDQPSTNTGKSSISQTANYRGHKFNTANSLLGYYIHCRIRKALRGDDRGLRRARFLVLRDAPCPAALVECGFLSNPKDEALFRTAKYRQLAAKAIAEGILEYASTAQRAKANTSKK